MKYFLCVLGMVFIIEGLPYFAFPRHIKNYLLKLVTVSNATLRAMGAFAVALGLLILWIGRR